VPYTEGDAEWFFGRDEWREIIRASLRSYRITVLYGSSGVGKSSVLRAGLMRRLDDEVREHLAERGAPGLLPVYFAAWSLDDPLEALEQAVSDAAAALGRGTADAREQSLADALGAWPERVEGPLLLVLDQLEELFVYHDSPGDSLLEELATALRRRDPAVHFLLSLREDALAKLDRFKGHVPGLLDHLLRLEHLGRDDARVAIVAPLELWSESVAAPGEQVEAEPAFVESVLDQVEAGKVALGEQGTGAAVGETRSGIEAPYLQLVLDRVWDEEQRDGSRVLRAGTLDRLGGATEIVRTHLDKALATLSSRDQEIAGGTFRHLVTPSGTKIALRLGDLAEYADVEETQLRPLVDELAGDVRILRSAGDGRYEIYHDALAQPVLDWTNRWEASKERRRHRKRMLVFGGVTGALAAVAIAIAILAIQARDAQDSARRSQSKALAAQAVATVDSDPTAALSSALQAENAWPTSEAEGALRVTLASDLVRELLRGHRGRVYSAAFSPDGKLVVTAGADGTARIWETAGGRRLHTLRSQGAVDSAAFSPDGTRVVTAGADGTARIWDTASGRSLHTLRGHRTPVESVAFSPNGTLVVTAGFDGTARIWDTASGRSLHTLSHRDAVYGAAFSADGKLVVTAGADRTAQIWGTASGRSLHILNGHREGVHSADFSADGKLVVTASFDGTARIWDTATGGSLQSLSGHGAALVRAAFGRDGKVVVTASFDRTARIWDTATGRSLYTLRGHRDTVESAAFSPDGKLVVTASYDGTARIWPCELCTAPLDELVSLARMRLGAQ
jgi:WD40 repeat protein